MEEQDGRSEVMETVSDQRNWTGGMGRGMEEKGYEKDRKEGRKSGEKESERVDSKLVEERREMSGWRKWREEGGMM